MLVVRDIEQPPAAPRRQAVRAADRHRAEWRFGVDPDERVAVPAL